MKTQTNQEPQAHLSEIPAISNDEEIFFPAALLIFTLLITVASLFWLVYNTYQTHRINNSTISTLIEINNYFAQLQILGGKLTIEPDIVKEGNLLNANHLTKTIEQAYLLLEKPSKVSIKEHALREILPDTRILEEILIKIEKKYNSIKENNSEDIELNKNNKLEIRQYQRDFVLNIEEIIKNYNLKAQETIDKQLANALFGLAPLLFISVILAVFWLLAINGISVWRKELTNIRNTLGDEKTYLTTILDNMLQGVITINAKGEILTFNRWAETLFGYTQAEIIGQNVKILMPEPYQSEHDSYLDRYAKTGKANILEVPREMVAISKAGKTFPINLRITEVKTSADESYFVGLVLDISQQKERELKLRQAKREADQASKAKSDFLANMSHELRTPLNSILGLTKIILSDGRLENETRENLNIIDKASNALLNTVNDILDLSKIEAGYIELINKPFNANGLILSLIDQIRPLASKKGLTVLDNVKTMPPTYLIGDEFRLFRVLLNLAGNAVKYTNDGHIEISIEFRELENNKLEFICKISDTGIGIAADKVDKIFQKFSQADETIERRFGGTGLGLSITKHLTEIMGGKIKVQSIVNQGSVFTISIPFEKTTRIAEDEQTKQKNHVPLPENRIPAEQAHILIAEDHEFNKLVISKMLNRLGFNTFKIADNGRLAVEAFKSQSWNAILMDIHMPEMSGHQAAQKIRKLESEPDNSGSPIPIIAMTADVMPGTREDCLRSGMNSYISKPVDEFVLRSVLEHWFILKETNLSDPDEKKRYRPEDSANSAPANLKIIMDYAGGNPEALKQLTKSFLSKSDEDMKGLEEAAKEGDNTKWKGLAHKIKGSSGYMGAETLRKLCEEAQLMTDATPQDMEKKFETISSEYKKVSEFIRKTTGI